MSIADAEVVLEFWFGSAPDDAAVYQEKGSLWWTKSDELDRTLKDRFGALRERARHGELTDWITTPRGRLAAIVLLDQFSRNIFRGHAEAFSGDAAAVALALEGIAQGDDGKLRVVERCFMYMPLMHAEDVAMQHRGVELFEALAAAAPPSVKQACESYVKYAKAHRDIVVRFGRFPHRNATLGRTSTAEEIEFLRQPGGAF